MTNYAEWLRGHNPPEPAPDDAKIIRDLRAENARLRKGIQDYLDGNYPNPRDHRPGKCEHGHYYWETCDGCDTAHFKAVLGASHTPRV